MAELLTLMTVFREALNFSNACGSAPPSVDICSVCQPGVWKHHHELEKVGPKLGDTEREKKRADGRATTISALLPHPPETDHSLPVKNANTSMQVPWLCAAATWSPPRTDHTRANQYTLSRQCAGSCRERREIYVHWLKQ